MVANSFGCQVAVRLAADRPDRVHEEASADALGRFLDRCTVDGRSVRQLWMMLFNHGVDSVGDAPIELWRGLAARATDGGTLVGLRERAYPRAFVTFTRYRAALREHLPPGDGLRPGALSIDASLRLHDEVADRHAVGLAGDAN